MAGRIQNLKPWPKGVSGNPGGRPKKRLISDELERLLQEEAPDAGGNTCAAVMAEALLSRALKGDLRAIAEITNRVEGKSFQAVGLDVNSPEDIESLSDEELEKRIAELTEKLGFVPRERS